MDCHEAQDKIQAWLDNALDANELAETKEHLKSCPQCRLRHRMFLLLDQGLRNLPLDSPSPDFNKIVLERLDMAFQAKKQPAWMGWSLAGGLSLLVTWLLAIGFGALMVVKNVSWHQLLSWIRHPGIMLNNMEQVFLALGLRLYNIFSFAAKVMAWLPTSHLLLQMLFSSLLAMALIALTLHFLKPINDSGKL